MEKKVRKIDSRTLPVYPEYHAIETTDHYDLLTFVRKEHEGIWYVIAVRINEDYQGNISSDRRATLKKEMFSMFLYEVYKVILFYKIDPEMIIVDGIHGRPIINVDEDQRSEYERLIPKI